MPTAKQRAIANLRFVREITNKLIKDFPETKATFQASPTDNHLAWTLGHMAMTNAWFVGLATGKKADLPEGYEALFGYKSTPKADAGLYPPLAELKRHDAAQFEALIESIEKHGDDDLAKVCAGDSGGFAKDFHEIADRAAWHEGWHAGQVSSLRRALGLPSVM